MSKAESSRQFDYLDHMVEAMYLATNARHAQSHGPRIFRHRHGRGLGHCSSLATGTAKTVGRDHGIALTAFRTARRVGRTSLSLWRQRRLSQTELQPNSGNVRLIE